MASDEHRHAMANAPSRRRFIKAAVTALAVASIAGAGLTGALSEHGAAVEADAVDMKRRRGRRGGRRGRRGGSGGRGRGGSGGGGGSGGSGGY
jgi:hypothetical protein